MAGAFGARNFTLALGLSRKLTERYPRSAGVKSRAPIAAAICVVNESLKAGSGCSSVFWTDGLISFSGRGSLLSSRSMDASSAAKDAPNGRTQMQLMRNRIDDFTGRRV